MRFRIEDPQRLPVVPFEGERGLPLVSQVLEAGALRQRFAQPPRWSPELFGDRPVDPAQALRPAAVLIGFLPRPGGAGLLLTRRSEQLVSHRGQIAFPGGRVDASDPSPIAAALREAHEEVGIPPDDVEVLGTLPEYLTGSGYRITPVVGLIEPAPVLAELAIEPAEVAEVFEVPARFLMDPGNHQRRIASWVEGGVTTSRSFLAMPWQAALAPGVPESEPGREYFIWGATAAILRNLYRFLAA
ncbi:MAG: CoA pyrophosphatase [Lautropia sp.]